jgi:hypothetical protein
LRDDQQTNEEKRRRAIRTALVLAGVVLLIYLGFIGRGFFGGG